MNDQRNMKDIIGQIIDQEEEVWRKERQEILDERSDAFDAPVSMCMICGKRIASHRWRKNQRPMEHCSVECRAWYCLYFYEQTGFFVPIWNNAPPIHQALYAFTVVGWVLLEAEKTLTFLEINRRARRLGGTRNYSRWVMDRMHDHGYVSGGDRRIGGNNNFVLTEKGRAKLEATVDSAEGRQAAASLLELMDEWYMRLVQEKRSEKKIFEMNKHLRHYMIRLDYLAGWGLIKRKKRGKPVLTEKGLNRLARRDEIWLFLRKNGLNHSGLIFPSPQ